MNIMHSFNLTIKLGERPVINQEAEFFITQNDQSKVEFTVGQAQIFLVKTKSLLKVEIPLASPDQLYFSRDLQKLSISNDPRSLFRNGMEIDIRGLYSLLQFGAIVPPLSIWTDVKRFTPGKRFIIDINTLNVIEQKAAITWPTTKKVDYFLNANLQQEMLIKLIDKILIESCPYKDPIILFSGGVDSGVLAARTSAMGWKKTKLINYCMGNDDKESFLAENMAKHLGLSFLRINDRDYNSFEMLNRIANTFRCPFGDHSSLPTYNLSFAVLENFSKSRVIIDGTGADGAFGLFGKTSDFRKLYSIPRTFRKVMGYLYKAKGYWKNVSRIEYFLRLCRRSVQMPMLQASIAQNPLLGITYHVQDSIYFNVLDLIERWMKSTIPSDNDKVRLSAIDLALVCSEIFAQKNKSIFDAHSRQIIYPFLDHRMVELALQRACYWPGSKQPKWVLKSILASHVPQDMVYRSKSAFIAPIRQKFSQLEFLKAFDQLLNSKSVLTDVLDLVKMNQLRKIIVDEAPLPSQTYNFIWVAVFTNLWLSQLEHSACLQSKECLPKRFI